MIGPIGFEGSGGSFSIMAFNQDMKKHHILLWAPNLMHKLLNKLKNKNKIYLRQTSTYPFECASIDNKMA